MTTIDRAGLEVTIPSGWEGEMYARGAEGEVLPPPLSAPPDAQAFGPSSDGGTVSPGGGVYTAGRTFLHLATFPLPAERADYGNGAVQHMGPNDIFIALLEHSRADAALALFAPVGIPRFGPLDFSTDVLHRRFPGHSGHQRFFHVGERAFCLYIVLGSHWGRSELVPEVNRLLEGIRIR